MTGVAEMADMKSVARHSAVHAHRETGSSEAKLFQSFWMGGFESACQINTLGVRIDMLAATQHDVQVREDYELVKSVGMRCVRDGVRWPCVELSPGNYDWSSFVPM